ncbi:hypothetical protein JG688_00018190 [Phytophthora aleatoria]|uniref:RxLR effector protein n=1 Tax=Phytophthora aleatoria TaxID=2496075 RepID=A0A8J5HZX3_9STRA|nr:hypothetical protein JG688_00018190 [Phytophthora aleatoria]
MRLSSILLAAAAALLANCDAASTASLTKLSAIIVPDAVKAVAAPANTARHLRGESQKQAGVGDSVDEERAGVQLGFVDDVVKKLDNSDDAAKKLIASDDIMAKRLAAVTKQLDEANDIEFLVKWWTQQNLKPEDVKKLTKTPVREKAYKQFLVQHLRQNHSLKPIQKAKPVTREGGKIQRQIDANRDVKTIITSWNQQKLRPVDVKKTIQTPIQKKAYSLFIAQIMLKRNSLNPSG